MGVACGTCKVSQQCYDGEVANCQDDPRRFDSERDAEAFAGDVRAILSPCEALPYSECITAPSAALGGRGES